MLFACALWCYRNPSLTLCSIHGVSDSIGNPSHNFDWQPCHMSTYFEHSIPSNIVSPSPPRSFGCIVVFVVFHILFFGILTRIATYAPCLKTLTTYTQWCITWEVNVRGILVWALTSLSYPWFHRTTNRYTNIRQLNRHTLQFLAECKRHMIDIHHTSHMWIYHLLDKIKRMFFYFFTKTW